MNDAATTSAETVSSYFTILVPWVAPEFRTEWHPTEKTGPFAVLSRGAFKTEDEAVRWGRAKLGGNPYSVKEVVP